MRANLLIIGATISLAATAQVLLNGVIGTFTAPSGILNLLLGLRTPKPHGVSVPPRQQASPRLLVDRGVYRAAIYYLAFFETRLVMKKLASAKTTVILPIVLFLVAFTLEGSPIAAISGGLTGYSIQEFLTQKGRDRTAVDSLSRVGQGDVQLEYTNLEAVRLRTNSLYLYRTDGPVRISLPRRYAAKMRPTLKELLPGKFEEEVTLRPASS